MTIDRSGQWWTGDRPEDLREYLNEYAANSYPLHEFRLARCSCGCEDFSLEADALESTARRHCASCGERHYICDSEDTWDDAHPIDWRCVECDCPSTNIGVGFSLYLDDAEVKWVYVGCRCAGCGILGCFADWQVAFTPSRYLFDIA